MKKKRNSKDPLIFHGIKIIKSTEGLADVEISIDASEDMMNPNGIVHGGMTYTLSDTCAGMSAYNLGYIVSTIQGNINYIRPHSRGNIVAKSTLVHHGRTTIVSRVDTYNEEEKLVTTGIFTMAIIEER